MLKVKNSAAVQVCQPCRRAAPGKHAGPQHDPVERVCVICSAPFVARSKTAKYCTDQCRWASKGGGRRPTPEQRRHYERNRASTTARGYGGQWPALRRQVLAKETHCGFCGEEVDKTLPHSDPMSASVDHKIRKRDGGDDSRKNLRLAHRRCNSADGGASNGQPRYRAACQVCGGSFQASYSAQKTCSRACGVEYRRRGGTYSARIV